MNQMAEESIIVESNTKTKGTGCLFGDETQEKCGKA